MRKLVLISIALVYIFAYNLKAANQGDIIITEYMANPAEVGDSDGEYFEIYNTTGSDINIDGWIIKDDGSDSHTIDNGGTLIVPANGFLVFGQENATYNMHDYAIPNDWYIGNGGDEIVLVEGSTEICRITYSNGDQFGAGIACELNNINSHILGVTQEGDYVAATSPLPNYPSDLGSPKTAGNTVVGGGGPPTKLVIISVNGGSSPDVGVPFDVLVQAQDDSNVPQNVASNVNVSLTLATGTGNLGGTLTGTISSGNSNLTISGVTYDLAESGVSITVSDDASNLSSGTSELFTVTSGPTVLDNIADLRAGTLGEDYTLSNEVILTFQQSFRNQKYIQDATAAILIDDNDGIITTTYSINDGITGITGTLGQFGGMLQFAPSIDPGPPTSPGSYTITPQMITLDDLTSNFEEYESELITINNVTFENAGEIFATGSTYTTTDASGAFDFRTTFYDADYIGEPIPSTVSVTALPNSYYDVNYYTARSLADFTYTGLPEIIKAYAISDTEVDVFYNVAPPSVDAGDYYILGTSTISFNGAVIDGTDPTLVHLSLGSPAMVGDITLDEIFDDAYESSYEFYAGIMPIAFTNTNNPGGVMLDETMATFQGIVSASDGSYRIWLSDAAGQYNGIFVYGADYATTTPEGEEIIIAGVRSPYSNLSELKNTILVSTVSSGNTPYGPDVILGSDIEETITPDMNPAEPWEGQLVKIENFTVTAYDAVNFDYTCSWSDTDLDYTFHIGDAVNFEFSGISLTVGATYTSVTGVIDWDYGDAYYRINPRDMSDIETSSNPATQLAVTSVNNGNDPYTETDFEVVVQAQDSEGNPASVASDVNFNLTTNGGDSGLVEFVFGTTTTGTILSGTSEITLIGVQMSPEGINVTITANDDQLFGGLLSGTSDSFDVIEFSIPDLIITEIMQNPSAVGDGDGEWFEVFNNGDSDVDMVNWTIKDDGSNSHIINTSLVVPSKGFAVLGLNADQLLNGGFECDYVYNDFTLANGDDEVILLLPDGVTEVDRVNYDGGPIWPDPTGSSMTYTGFPNDDNNDGSLWIYSTFREASYDNSDDDKGSPGSEGYDQILTGGFKLDLKAFLEGAFISDETMSNYFKAEDLLPMEQPFNPTLPYYGNSTIPWLYSETEVLSYIPYNTTDWLLVELRDATSAATATSGTMIAQYPVLLSDTGTITSLNGSLPLNVKTTFSNDMYIVIWSLNHLSVMSAAGITPVDGTTVTYDFSTGAGQVYGGTAYKELETGVWGLMSGDINGDQTVDEFDYTDGWIPDAGKAAVYQGNNLLPDGQIDNKDKNDKWDPNFGVSTEVPD